MKGRPVRQRPPQFCYRFDPGAQIGLCGKQRIARGAISGAFVWKA
jgi:hypothetical protein